MKLSIRIKTMLLLSLLATAPVLVLLWRLLPDFDQAIRQSEAHSQILVVERIRRDVELSNEQAVQDARTIASAVAHAAHIDDAAVAQAVVKQSLLRCSSVAAARLQIPEAGVDTVIARADADTAAVPVGSEAMQQRALGEGQSLHIASDTMVAVTVPVPQLADGKQGFITVPLYPRAIEQTLGKLIANANLDDVNTSALVIDDQKRIVASYNADATIGQDASAFEVMKIAPDEMSRIPEDALQFSAEQQIAGRAVLTTMSLVPKLGWGVLVWRPRDVALVRYSEVERLAWWLSLITLGVALVAALLSARRITAPILSLVEKAGVIAKRQWRAIHPADMRSDEIGQLSRAMTNMARALEDGENEIERQAKLRNDLSRFMSHELVEAIVEGKHDLALGGSRAPVSVMFADVVAFTPMAEKHPPEKMVALLNELFSVLTEVVFRHGGIVDKFVGDCIMAVWGAPVTVEAHAQKALECAEDIMAFVEAGAEGWRERYGVEVRLGIGINSGDAIVGNIGSDKRMEFTVIGDVVNVAARLETMATPDQVLVAEGTAALVDDTFELRRLGERRLTGREKETTVYELRHD